MRSCPSGLEYARLRDRLAVEIEIAEIVNFGKRSRISVSIGALVLSCSVVDALDALVVWEHLQREIEMIEDERQLLGGHRAAHLARLSGDVFGIVGIGDGCRDLPLRVRRWNLCRYRRAQSYGTDGHFPHRLAPMGIPGSVDSR